MVVCEGLISDEVVEVRIVVVTTVVVVVVSVNGSELPVIEYKDKLAVQVSKYMNSLSSPIFAVDRPTQKLSCYRFKEIVDSSILFSLIQDFSTLNLMITFLRSSSLMFVFSISKYW